MKDNERRAQDHHVYHLRLREYEWPTFDELKGQYECRMRLDAMEMDSATDSTWGFLDMLFFFPPQCLSRWGTGKVESDDLAKRIYLTAIKSLRSDDEREVDLARRDLRQIDVSAVDWWPKMEVIRRPHRFDLTRH